MRCSLFDTFDVVKLFMSLIGFICRPSLVYTKFSKQVTPHQRERKSLRKKSIRCGLDAASRLGLKNLNIHHNLGERRVIHARTLSTFVVKLGGLN